MDKVPYQNKGDTPVIIGSVTIPPGQTRGVDPRLVPGATRAAPPEEETPPDPLLELLDENVASVTEALPACTPEELDRLEVAEKAGKTRKGVLEAIAAERLHRASEQGGDGGTGEGSGEGTVQA